MTSHHVSMKTRSSTSVRWSIWAHSAGAGALLVSLLVPTAALALVIGGGGSKRTDCLAVLDAPANDPITKPRKIRCTDGDAACDADGVVNGVCLFPVAVCANSTFSPDCALNGVQSMTVDHAADNGDPKFDPEFQAMQNRLDNDVGPPTNTSDQCTNFTNFRVFVEGPLSGVCKKGKKQLRLVTVSQFIQGRIYTDKDKLKMTCDPAPGACDPLLLFDGTFDRVQTQIFNKSCAVSGCHDSQSQTGGLLLETGASLSNLVNVAPNNPAAAAAGWQRVTVIDANTGDPDTSLLFHKLVGPPNGFGERMPFGRKKLDQSLINVVQLWIAAGAPDTGWVPGTDQ
jgi:hypothetical protein